MGKQLSFQRGRSVELINISTSAIRTIKLIRIMYATCFLVPDCVCGLLLRYPAVLRQKGCEFSFPLEVWGVEFVDFQLEIRNLQSVRIGFQSGLAPI